jgi:WXG100 family type VII secretion target
MAGTSIDDATLHAAANDCRSGVEQVQGEQTKVRNTRDTVAASWQGAASTTFQGVMDAWGADCGKLMEAMNAIADLLDQTATTHRANEEEQDTMFAKFNSMINPG